MLRIFLSKIFHKIYSRNFSNFCTPINNTVSVKYKFELLTVGDLTTWQLYLVFYRVSIKASEVITKISLLVRYQKRLTALVDNRIWDVPQVQRITACNIPNAYKQYLFVNNDV